MMNQSQSEFPEGASGDATERAVGRAACDDDVLLARAVAGDRAAMDAVCERGAVEPKFLEEFARWQADEIRLARASRMLDTLADQVDAKRDRFVAVRSPGLGWAVAAVLAVLFFARAWTGEASSNAPANVAGIGGPLFSTSEDAFHAYLEKAREEGVMVSDPEPPMYLGARELGDGSGFEVVVVRQVYEIRRTPKMYRMQPIDDAGRVRPVAIRPRTETLR